MDVDGSVVEVRELDLGDVITMPESHLRSPATIIGISDGAIGVRFIDLKDVETGVLNPATLCLAVGRGVVRHRKGNVPPSEVGRKSMFGG